MTTTADTAPVRVTGRPSAVRARPATRTWDAGTWVRLVLACLLAFVQLFPLLWMLSSAFKSAEDTRDAALIPEHPTFDNVVQVFTRIPYATYLWNSLLTSVLVTVLLVFFGSMAAYALARLRFRGRAALFGVVFSTLMVAMPVILVPLFMVVARLGLVNTYAGLILPVAFTAFPIFLMRQFYLRFPRELEEAADLDGCGHLRRFLLVVLPLSKTMLAALGVTTFLSTWNSFLWPLTVAKDSDLWVVQVGMSQFQNQYGGDWSLIMAASLIAAVPTLLLFLLLQRQIVESVQASGLKG
ncbi:carbohydrate ABC transporter permease [Streptomyces jeddahensis]|uniref:L-arabinose transport system permease protein AraQ n=1 Tax=Streptomyces jeddahensis TaxID=1716141 RepID=A0A177HII2_9ACTN|nr:carbohydrate ABC transporter permease [Streptomyces jeddahensis]OAH10187.1 L-arabinose transport system permease protein AraQ [Streptomyces jeddahensis]